MSGRLSTHRGKVEQAHVEQLLHSIGAAVYVSGTVRRRGDYRGTMQTPGIPDVEAFLPPRPGAERAGLWQLLKVEVKAGRGRLSPAQRVYRERCVAAGVWHVVGGLDALIAFLAARGYVRTEAFPHYRQPKESHP